MSGPLPEFGSGAWHQMVERGLKELEGWANVLRPHTCRREDCPIRKAGHA